MTRFTSAVAPQLLDQDRPPEPIKVLLVEDDEDDQVLISRLLSRLPGRGYDVRWVTGYDVALATMGAERFDVCLLDYRLGEHTGIEILEKLKRLDVPFPVILLTGQGGYALDVEAMQAGATDFLTKSELTAPLLERTIRYSIRDKQIESDLEQRVQDRTRLLNNSNKCLHEEVKLRKEREADLRQSQGTIRALLDASLDAAVLVELDGTLVAVNAAAEEVLGAPASELIGRPVWGLVPAAIAERMRAMCLEQADACLPSRFTVEGEDGRAFESMLYPVQDSGGRVVRMALHLRDITEQVRAETALRHANTQKELYRLRLEAVFRSIPDTIITVDQDMRFQGINRSSDLACGLFKGLEPGMSLDLVPGMKPSPCYHVLSQTIQTGKPVVEYRAESCSEQPQCKVMVLNTSLLLALDGSFAGAVLSIRDITRLSDLEKRLDERAGFMGIIGKSAKMQFIYHLLEHFAAVESTVLITGESGTGKELVAESLHFGGVRAAGPLVKVNCTALSEGLLESELFGHVRGAFTGAVRDRTGRFQAAQGGTLFLDEIGDISPQLQTKLLRVLEDKVIERVGESVSRKVDVRIVAATNADLADKVRKGLFRGDLYYRLKVMEVCLPPLRERVEDIPMLAQHFIRHFSKALKKNLSELSGEVLHLLVRHPWPGNIRELKHVIERGCVLCPGGEILPSHLPAELLDRRQGQTPMAAERRAERLGNRREQAQAPAERRDNGDGASAAASIQEALRQAGGNKAKAARLLGVSRRTLYRHMDQLGINSN